MAKILVTGGMGFIGSHTVVELLEKEYEVLILDNLYNSDKKILHNIHQITGKMPQFIQLDLLDEQGLDTFFSQNTDIQAVIHFAALKAVGESVRLPLKYYKNNLDSLIHILEMMLKYEIANLVFSSSCTVYGQPDSLPVTEQSPIKKAESPYGNTKQIGEEIIADTVQAYPQLRAISLRYFNPIGAHKSGLLGELPQGIPNNLMPFITQTAIGLRDNLKVYGGDYDTLDGTCVRDYIHVSDLAKAHVIATERLLAQKNATNLEYFNLGTGKGNTVLEVIQSFEKTTQQKLKYEIVHRRPGDVVKIYADTAAANQVLGWHTEKNLDDMTASAWQWEVNYRKQQAE
ncbi:MAG: UDP-glucose 4-epimerase GalE [Microscillaceae bacterium]|jgi:UDP-glucose 4-epimerase|nr:UDP-glucose 4-epimerase GalE [Microscillaceae bacterium]